MDIIKGNVFSGTGELILNPCNCETTLYWGTHVSGHIFWHAGKVVQKQRKAAGYLQYGEFCLTDGGKLSHRKILHVAVHKALTLDMRYLVFLRKRIEHGALAQALDGINLFMSNSKYRLIDSPKFWGGTNGWSDKEFDLAFGNHPALSKMVIYSK